MLRSVLWLKAVRHYLYRSLDWSFTVSRWLIYHLIIQIFTHQLRKELQLGLNVSVLVHQQLLVLCTHPHMQTPMSCKLNITNECKSKVFAKNFRQWIFTHFHPDEKAVHLQAPGQSVHDHTVLSFMAVQLGGLLHLLFLVLCFIPKSDLILQQNLETIFELEWWYFLWMWKKWIQTTSIYELKMMDSRVSYLYSLLHLSHTCTRTADSTVTPYWRRNWANMFQAPSQTNLQKCSEDFSYCLPDVFEIIVSKIFF